MTDKTTNLETDMDTVRAITIDGKPHLVYCCDFGDMPPVLASMPTEYSLWTRLREFAADQSGNAGIFFAGLCAMAAIVALFS